jgi:T-Q ester bond containing domain
MDRGRVKSKASYALGTAKETVGKATCKRQSERSFPMMTLLASAAMTVVMASGALAEITMSGKLVDAEDENRFFTRLGGEARDDLSISGLDQGKDYILTTILIDAASGREIETVDTPFTAETAAADVSVTLPVPRNEGDVNIDYVTRNLLREPGSEIVLLEMTGDALDLDRAIQVHSIQRVSVISVKDAADGDNRIDGQGGKIEVVVGYENMVEGYAYTIWGQILTPSGQSRGIFASIPEYKPERKAGEVTLTFDIPAGLDGISVLPSVGIFHQNRVEILEDGNISWIPGAANPVMIASDTDLKDESRMIEVGVPFGQTE